MAIARPRIACARTVAASDATSFSAWQSSQRARKKPCSRRYVDSHLRMPEPKWNIDEHLAKVLLDGLRQAGLSIP
jgi:hypothetical protein